MKVEMHMKSGCGSPIKSDEESGMDEMIDKQINRPKVFNRTTACFALLVLLGISGYVGSNNQKANPSPTVSVIRQTVVEDGVYGESADRLQEQYEEDRSREISMLDGVLSDPNIDMETKNRAQAQKVEVVRRMEEEAQVRVALKQMGFNDFSVICGAQMMTVILEQDAGLAQADAVRTIDAVCAVTGLQPQDVKVIFAEK